MYLWLGSKRDTMFPFAFRSKITWNDIFEATNCKRIILIFFLMEERQKAQSPLQRLFGYVTQRAISPTGGVDR